MGKILDLTNQRFGKLIVISRAEKPINSKSTSVFWLCKCDCGNEKIISSNVLRSGKAKSCGCYNKEFHAENYKDISGQTFGTLTVIKKVPRPENLTSPGAYWLCKCTCGKEKIILGKSLIQGKTKSCGACRIDMVDDLTGQIFDKLTVIERDYSIPSNWNGAYWKCKCECGNFITVLGKNLKHYPYHSCGCIKSIGENEIKKILDENLVNYKREYTFNDLISKKGALLRFDFAILNNNNELLYLIEFQGEQHYENNSLNWSPDTIEHDKLKKEYCNQHKIPLIEIPYWKRGNITLKDLLYERKEVE